MKESQRKETSGPTASRAVARELVALKKLLCLWLQSQGLNRSVIAKSLGITTAADVRKLMPVEKITSRKGRSGSTANKGRRNSRTA